MAMSGISVSKDCEETHEKQKKLKNIQWTIYKIGKPPGQEEEQQQNRGKKAKEEVIVDSSTPKYFSAKDAMGLEPSEIKAKSREAWLRFVEELPPSEPRYAVFDFVVQTKSAVHNDMLRFIAWSPDISSVKQKMVYSSTKDYLRRKLDMTKETFLCSKNPEDVDAAFEELMENH